MKSIIKFYSELNQTLKNLDPDSKKVSFYIFVTYFLVLLSYPLIRSSVSSFFYESYSSKDYSFASFVGVAVLMGMIYINNKLQARLGVHRVYFLSGIFSIVIFLVSFFFYNSGVKQFAYCLFAMKEAYIVLLIHTCLAFSNSYYPLNLFKKLIGPIGAAGSIGGILGGQLTSFMAKSELFGTNIVFYTSLILILFTVISFYQTKKFNSKNFEPNKSITPINAIRGVKKYVLLIASIVAVSQFVIFIADLQFNIIFEKVVTLKDERTAYLGNFYTLINVLSLFLQFVLLPFILDRLQLKSIFLFIPIFYFILIFSGLSFGATQLVVVAFVFISMKGTDYSVFSVAKEVMYHPLMSLQKYGAKYITDMIVYRSAKALIALIFAQEVIKRLTNSMIVLSTLQFVFLSIWIILIYKLFIEQNKIKKTLIK